MIMSLVASNKPENIEYHGRYGVTQYCLDAIIRLIQCGEWINRVYLLTCDKRHCFLLTIDEDQYVVIKAGFTSGYNGEGPRGLAAALSLFDRHRIEVEEYEISTSLMKRLNGSSLTKADLELLKAAPAIRPLRLYDYIHPFIENHNFNDTELNRKFPAVVPFRIIDPRIMDMALKLESDADSALITAYRRLEQIVLVRCKQTGLFGSELFKRAFSNKDSYLYWSGLDGSEGAGRASLFNAAYMAFRNKRAHKEQKNNPQNTLREFLILNELYLLEAEAIERPSAE